MLIFVWEVGAGELEKGWSICDGGAEILWEAGERRVMGGGGGGGG